MKKMNVWNKGWARLANKVPRIFQFVIVVFLALSAAGALIAATLGLSSTYVMEDAVINNPWVTGTAFLALFYLYIQWAAASFFFPGRLPEVAYQRANELIKKHSQAERYLAPLMAQTMESDDATYLCEKMEKFQRFYYLKEELPRINSRVDKIKKEIDALERELSL